MSNENPKFMNKSNNLLKHIDNNCGFLRLDLLP